MCQKIQCPKCRKWTWQGCGQHKDAVLRDVPVENRCVCGMRVQNGTYPLQLGYPKSRPNTRYH